MTEKAWPLNNSLNITTRLLNPYETLARRYGINPRTVAKWKKRTSVADLPTDPKQPRSTVLSIEEEAAIVAFRKHTLLPLDDCLYALQATTPHLTRSSLHRCLQRHGISRLPEPEGDKPVKKHFKPYPIDGFHIDIARCIPPRVSSTCSWPSTEPPSSLSPNCIAVPTRGWRRSFCAIRIHLQAVGFTA